MANTAGVHHVRGWKKRHLAEKAERRRAKRQGKNRLSWWVRVGDTEQRHARRARARDLHKLTKAEKTAGRVSLSKEERYQKQLYTNFRKEQERCPRRAILVHPDGGCPQ